VRLAVLGDPLRFTRSPELHRAGCAFLGMKASSVALRTPAAALEDRLAELAAAGYAGTNLTHPLKADVLRFVDRASEAARRARSANTVGFGTDGTWAETTDGDGFLDLLRELRRDPAAQRTVLLGAGGSSRSLALALEAAGAAPPVVAAREPAKRAAAWAGLPARLAAWRSGAESEALADATLVVNCTPLRSPAGIVPLERVRAGALIVDLVYGPEPTALVRRARDLGPEAVDGLGLLVHQARRSLALWFGREVPAAVLAGAVGWPR
jgi:shikimate dehydrogenase